MAKRKRNENRTRLLREMIAEYGIESIADLQTTLKDMFAETMEDMLKGELDATLGYEKNSQNVKETTNRRNGSYEKKIQSNLGETGILIPRDREGEYEPQLVPVGTKDVSGLEEKILSMYGKGISDRDISDTINEIYGFTMSHDTISRIVDRVQPRLAEWQSRTLESVYTFVYLDALMANVKSDGKSMKKAVYSAIGVNSEGKKDVLGIWINETEGTHFWLSIFDELKARGVKKLLFVCIDGLSGLEEAIKNVFPTAVVQRCMVHLVRNSTKYIPVKQRKEFCTDLKAIYSAVNRTASREAMEILKTKWSKYPSAVKVWADNFIYVEQLFDYSPEIRKMIYTTNMIEAFNSGLRKVTNRKASFPSDISLFKILFLRIADITARWKLPIANWAVIRGKLDLIFPDWETIH